MIIAERSNSVNVTERSLREQRTQPREHRAQFGPHTVEWHDLGNGWHTVIWGVDQHYRTPNRHDAEAEFLEQCRFYRELEADRRGADAYLRCLMQEAEEAGEPVDWSEIDYIAEVHENRRFLERHNSREDV